MAMHREWKTKAILAALALILASSARAQTSGSAFLNIPTSPRAYSLGQSNVAATGAQAIGRNPANAGLVKQRLELFSSYATMMGGARFQHVAAVFAPAGLSVDALGFALTRLQAGGFDGADSLGNKTGDSFGGGDTAASVTASALVASSLRLGATLKVLRSEIGGYKSGAGLAGDFGLTYTLPQFQKPCSLAVSVTNAGQGVKFLDQRDSLPTSLNMGMALPLGPVVTVLEINRMIYDKRTEFGLGLEYNLGPAAFRVGYLAANSGYNPAANDQKGAAKLLQGMALGMGINIGPVKVDYALSEQAVEFGPTHRLGLTLRWGDAPGKAAKAKKEWKFEDRSDWMIVPMGSY